MDSWIVEVECVVRKQLVCDGCTEQQARLSPWLHVNDETELEQIDWKVMSVKPNE